MPTEHMDNPIAIDQIETKPLGVTPLALPPSPLGPVAPLPRTAPAGTGGTCRDIRSIDPQYQYRTAPVPRPHLDDMSLDLVTLRTFDLLAGVFVPMSVRNNGLGEAPGKRVAQIPHRLRHLC